jgi:hypothetical protein
VRSKRVRKSNFVFIFFLAFVFASSLKRNRGVESNVLWSGIFELLLFGALCPMLCPLTSQLAHFLQLLSLWPLRPWACFIIAQVVVGFWVGE